METLLISKLPGVFAVFGPLADVMPVIPVLFFLLAFTRLHLVEEYCSSDDISFFIFFCMISS